MAGCLRAALLLLLLLVSLNFRGHERGETSKVSGQLQPAPSPPLPPPGSVSVAGGNRCVDAAEACTADARCQRLRTEYVARCLGQAAPRSCHRARCHRALRRFFSRGAPALTHALLFCPCASPACAERRRQTFVPACAFYGPGAVRPSCLETLDACAQSRVCRPRLLVFQASCLQVPSAPDGCLRDRGPRCLRAYAGLMGTAITPNYLDNSSARVEPWCDCRASGNRREECEAFRGLFTKNQCLDGAIQAFGSRWSGILQVQLDSHWDPGHNLLQFILNTGNGTPNSINDCALKLTLFLCHLSPGSWKIRMCCTWCALLSYVSSDGPRTSPGSVSSLTDTKMNQLSNPSDSVETPDSSELCPSLKNHFLEIPGGVQSAAKVTAAQD
ncbi:GDNF family receptor alpha-4 [Heterocephalus glaber]|uniref:GDNF family receptor alpha-4 n=1 Tax=Heterocephalus glaber TaxID=10181 RepID=A0AAX6SLI8_HETGA|nr:GDNF family receptor alpha-4 [Heterocephalus glaber]